MIASLQRPRLRPSETLAWRPGNGYRRPAAMGTKNYDVWQMLRA